MGFIDLSTSVAAKKHVDLNDARYQLADKLKYNENKNVLPTFSLYDNKDSENLDSDDLSSAYELSDKKLSIGELLNKIVDIIVDMEDGVLDKHSDAIHAWKYSVVILKIYDDKIKTKRKDPLISFDNGLKNSIINSKLFMNKFPGKYTNRTNFYNNKVKEELIGDIIDVFENETMEKIHQLAINRSKTLAEEHNNPILNKIITWANNKFNCKIDTYYDIKTNTETHLWYSINTIILHFKNGYDVSIVGFTGTDRDDKFAISIFDANDATIKGMDERLSKNDIQNSLSKIPNLPGVSPLTQIIENEKEKLNVFKKQLNVLSNTRPMIKENILKLQVAKNIVGDDYIWGCEKFRKGHCDLPDDFKLSDIKLPTYIEKSVSDSNNVKNNIVNNLKTNDLFSKDSLNNNFSDTASGEALIEKNKENKMGDESTLLPGVILQDDESDIIMPITAQAKHVSTEGPNAPAKQVPNENNTSGLSAEDLDSLFA